MRPRWLTYVSCALALAATASSAPAAWDVYANSQDGTAIPDVDKPDPNDPNDNSCWAAAAANLLAAGGWGKGAPAQDAASRASWIYGNLIANGAGNFCGNAGGAMKQWLNTNGQNPQSADFDNANQYTNVNATNRNLVYNDYANLLNGLKGQTPAYGTVLWWLPATQTHHWLTLVGGDYDPAPQTNQKQAVWHDSDRTVGGVADNAYTNSFANGAWTLSDYVANNTDEYDTLSIGLRLVATSPILGEYWLSRLRRQVEGGYPEFCMAGPNVSQYLNPTFESGTVLRLTNALAGAVQASVELLADYTGPADLSSEGQIYLLDDQGRRWDPTITVGPDGSQLKFDWELPYTPTEEWIVFPSSKYSTLAIDPSAGGDVLGWQMAGVPEPATLSLLALGGAVVMARRRRKI